MKLELEEHFVGGGSPGGEVRVGPMPAYLMGKMGNCPGPRAQGGPRTCCMDLYRFIEGVLTLRPLCRETSLVELYDLQERICYRKIMTKQKLTPS